MATAAPRPRATRRDERTLSHGDRDRHRVAVLLAGFVAGFVVLGGDADADVDDGAHAGG